MEVHLPKPLHGWREFAGEVGIIVIGVLIALGAEQVAAYFHQRAELREAEEAMTSELQDDDLPQAYTRAAVYNCYESQLDAIENAVSSGDRAKTTALAKAYKPVFRTWDDQAWKAAVASQVLAEAGAKRTIDWSSGYILIPLLSEIAQQESDALSRLWANLSGQGPLSAEQQDRLFEIISNLRVINGAMNISSLVFMKMVGERGLMLTPERERALMVEARDKYGPCVTVPNVGVLNTASQLSYVNGMKPKR